MATYEHEIEDTLTRKLAEIGHLCLKFCSPGFPGAPDRIVITKAGGVMFVECKRPGQKPTRVQRMVHGTLRAMGHRVEVVDTLVRVDQLCEELGA